MRRFLPFVGPLAVALLTSTCAEAPTGGRAQATRHAGLALTTALSPAATKAAALIHAAGLDVDRVRVLIVAPPSDTLKDTTIALVANHEQRLSLDIHADPGTTVTAIVNFTAGNTLLYSGSVEAVAYAIGTPDNEIPVATVTVVPVAAGISATRVTIPAAAPSPVNAPVTLVAHAFNDAGTEIAGAIFGWSVDDATIATVNAAGVVQPTAKSGTVNVTAVTLSGASATTAVMFYGPAARIVTVSGDAQSAEAGSALALPFVVQVQSATGGPVPNQTVTFGVANGSSVSPTSMVTDANGRAQTTPTLGPTVGTYGFSATTAGFTTNISATAVAGAVASIAVVSGDAQSDTILKTLAKPLVVKVSDRLGNAKAGITVNWARTAGAGSVSAATSTTDANGQASITYTLGASAGTETIAATTAGVTTGATFSATALAKPVSTALQFVQQPPSAVVAGATMSPAVTVRAIDAGGNIVPGFTGTVTIALGANPGSGTLGGTLTRTATAGVATFNDLSVNNVANGYTLQASSTGLTSATSAAFNVTTPPTARIEWTNTSGGSWSQASNWNLNRVPVTTDSVVIAAPGTYAVNLDTTFVGSVIVIGGGAGQQTVQLTSRALVTSTALAIKSTGVLKLSNAGIGGGGTVTNEGTILVPNTATITSPFANAAGGLLRIASDGSVGTAGLTIPNGFGNDGTVELSSTISTYSAALITSTQGAIVNNATGVINALAGTGGSRFLDGQLSNAGTINIDAPLTLTHASAAITTHDNSGTINVRGGSFTVTQTGSSARLINGGTISVNQGFALVVNGGVFLQQATLSGAGSASLNNASVAFNAPYTLPALSMNSSTASFSSDLSTATTALTMIGSTLNGPGRLVNAAGVTTTIKSSNIGASSELVNQGTLIANANNATFGPVTLAAGSTLRVQSDGSVGTATFTMNGINLVNDGTIELTSTVSTYNSVLSVTGSLTNTATGAINALAGTGGTRTISATLVNQGAITVNAPLTIDRASVTHSNDGTITVGGANLTINQTGTSPAFTNNGTISVAASRSLVVAGGTFTEAANATLIGAGGFSATNAVVNYNAAAFALPSLSLTGTTATFQPSLTTSSTAIALSSVTFNGPGTITNAAGQTMAIKNVTIDQSSGLINQGTLIANANNAINGPLTAAAGSTLRVQSDGSVGSADLAVANGFTNNGTIDLTSTVAGYGSSLTLGTGTLTNSATGTINASVGTGGARTIGGTIANQSLGQINVAAPLTISRAGVTHTNAGTINVTGGDLTVANGSSAGRLTNTGTIAVSAGRTLVVTDGNIDQNGTLSGAGSLATTNLVANFNVLPTVGAIAMNSTTGVFQQSLSTANTALSLDNGSVVDGPGSITNAAGKTLSMKNSTIASSSALTNQGLLLAIANNTISGALSTAGGSTIRVQSDGSVSTANLTVANGFANAGTIDLTSTVGPYVSSLTVSNGELINGTGATILASAGTGGARTLAAQLNNQSTITLNAPLTIGRPSATSSNFGTIDATNADLIVAQSGTTPTFTNVGTITIGPAHTWTVNGGKVTQQGTLNGGGTWTINAPTATILNTFTLSALNFIGTTVDLAPFVNTTGLALSLDGSSISGNGSLTNVAGQTMTIKNNSTVNITFSNAGRLNAINNNTIATPYNNTATAVLSVYSDGATSTAQLNLGATTTTNNGTIELTSTVGPYGSTVATTGTLTNAGTISVLTGTGGGRSITSGGFTNSSTGTISLGIGGTTAGTQYTQLTFNGAANFGGTLNVAYLNGFTATTGNAFALLNYTPGGTLFNFSTINLPGGAAGWTPTVGAASYTITHQ